MVEFLARKLRPVDDNPDAAVGMRMGRIIAIHEAGLPVIDFDGNPLGPLPARSIIRIDRRQLGCPILLGFENNDLRNPIIMGLLQPPIADESEEMPMLNRDQISEILIDGEKLVLDAKREIEIRCGKSSLVMKADGKVVIKGEQIISRARRVNKIKGAAVKIN